MMLTTTRTHLSICFVSCPIPWSPQDGRVPWSRPAASDRCSELHLEIDAAKEPSGASAAKQDAQASLIAKSLPSLNKKQGLKWASHSAEMPVVCLGGNLRLSLTGSQVCTFPGGLCGVNGEGANGKSANGPGANGRGTGARLGGGVKEYKAHPSDSVL